MSEPRQRRRVGGSTRRPPTRPSPRGRYAGLLSPIVSSAMQVPSVPLEVELPRAGQRRTQVEMRQEVAHQSFLGHLEADHLDAALLFGAHFGERAGIAAELDCERRGFGFDPHPRRGASAARQNGSSSAAAARWSTAPPQLARVTRTVSRMKTVGSRRFISVPFPGSPQARSEIPLRNPRATGGGDRRPSRLRLTGGPTACHTPARRSERSNRENFPASCTLVAR